MFNHAAQDYQTLKPKGRKILAALLLDYEQRGDEGLTRQQIAEQLNQHRLYPHDDRAIHRLQAHGFIHISHERLGPTLFREWPGNPFLQRNHISYHTVFHVHWLNALDYAALKPLLKADGLYIEPEFGYVGDIFNVVGNWLNRLFK